MSEQLPDLSGAPQESEEFKDPGLGPTALGAGYTTFNPEQAVKPEYPIPKTLQSPPSWMTVTPPRASKESIQAKIMASQNMALPSDNYKFSKGVMGDFRNPKYPNQDFARYEAYGKDIVNEVGFSPFRDNEAAFNASTSGWDDFKRSMNSFGNLFMLSMRDSASWGGGISDRESAKLQEKYMARGMSSKDGLGGAFTNFALNSAYTFGILAELAIEELAMFAAEAGLAALTAMTWGGAAPATIPAMVATGGAMVARAGRAGNKIWKGWKTGKKLFNAVDSMRDVNKARQAWMSFGKSAAKFINPLENTTDFIRNFNKLDNANDFVKGAKGFGAFYSDVIAARYVYAESGLEGGGVQLELERKYMEDFQQKEGRLPNQQETFDLLNLAKQGGMTAGLANAPTIFFSNKITLGKALRPAKKWGVDVITRGNLGRVAFDPRRAFKDNFVKLPSNFFKRNLWYLKNPRVVGRAAVKYSGANWVEGFQELSQEVIAGTTEDYYRAKYGPSVMKGGLYHHIGQNLKKQISPQGLETFLSGFLMQSLVGPVSGIHQNLKSGKLQSQVADTKTWLTDQATWTKIQKDRDSQLQLEVNMLNELYSDPNLYMSDDIVNMLAQNEAAMAMKDSEDDNDLKTYIDLKDASGAKHIQTALKYGRLEGMVDHWKALKQLTAEEIGTTYNMSQEDFNKALDSSIYRAEHIQKRHQYAQENMPNPFRPDKFKYLSPEWMVENAYAKEWNNAIEEFVFNQYTFDRALERQNSILSNAKEVSGLKNTPMSQFNVLFNLASADAEVKTLTDEIKSLEASGEMIAPEQKKFKKEKETTRQLLSNFLEAVTEGKVNQKEGEVWTEEDYDKIEKAFNDYVQYIGEKNGEFINTNDLKATFRSVLDYHSLSNRAVAANRAVNTLLDPKNFRDQVNRAVILGQQIMANKRNEIQASLKAYQSAMDGNDFLNALADKGMTIAPEDFAALMQGVYDKGMFFKPGEAEALAVEGKAPTDFYYSVEKDKKLVVEKGSDDYKEAIKILKSFVENLTNIDIGQVNTNPYDSVGRPKLENDKRTHDDLATQFKFETDKETTVLLTDVLEAISESKYATPAEQELAKSLLSIADKRETVTFVNNSTVPGAYSESKQTIIDPRWSSYDYRQGEAGAAIEQVILKQEVHRRAAEAVEEDQNFRRTMTSLMEESLEAYDKLSEEEKNKLIDPNTKGFEGFASVEDFVSETMSNERFQKFLAKIETKQKRTQSAWKNFVDAVINKIKELIGGIPQGTVLNAAMDAITAKFDGMYSSSNPQTKATSQTRDTQTTPGEGVTNKMSVSTLVKEHSELADELLEIYKNIHRSRKEQDPDYEIDVDNMTSEEIFNSVGFKNFFKSPEFKKKEDAIAKYNKDNKFTGKPAKTKPKAAGTEVITQNELDRALAGDVSGLRILRIAQKVKANEPLSPNETKIKDQYSERISEYIEDSTKEAPLTISKESVIMDRLRDLGYSKSFREGLSTTDAWKYYYENITKDERDVLIQEELADQEAARQSLKEQREELQKEIQDRIDAVESVEELDSIQADIVEQFEENPMFSTSVGYEMSDVINLITNKKAELKKELNFDKIVVGDVLMKNDRGRTQVEVTAKDNTGRWMVVRNLDTNEEQYIKEDEMKSEIKYVYKKGIDYTQEEGQDPITEEEVELSNESQETFDDIANEEMTKEDVEIGKSSNRDDLLNDFFEDINQC